MSDECGVMNGRKEGGGMEKLWKVILSKSSDPFYSEALLLSSDSCLERWIYFRMEGLVD